MNVLLLYPEFPKTTYWSLHNALPYIGKKASLPPLGLITIAALLPKEWNLKLIDLNIEKLKNKDIEWSDIVFTSTMIVQKESHRNVVQKIKSFQKPIVAGGPEVTQNPRARSAKLRVAEKK